MLELYLDSADIKQVARFQACLPIKGITTNPSILAKAGIGVNQLLAELNPLLEEKARFHVQVVSQSLDEIIAEARQITALPYDVVVKIPATEVGIAAIKQLHSEGIPLLATAIYSVQQGFLAALAGADYLAPYVNRIDNFGGNGVEVVAGLQQLLTQQNLACCVLPASFKNTRQVLDVLATGVGAITLPVEIMEQMFIHPAVPLAVEQFNKDWQRVFSHKLAFET
ncbi:MAG: fructose-6-phosphate aldolase [Methylococcaceae bacterium]|nr:fructose-6-phosphate aldolase [Methylococcaceae bacterium]